MLKNNSKLKYELMLDEYLKINGISYSKNVPLKSKTWVKSGGVAFFWITPITREELIMLGCFLYKNNINFEIVGSTSNCYFVNNYSPIVVISTLKISTVSFEKNIISCDCGFKLAKLSKLCAEKSIINFEGFIGIPGTVAGATINNSGARGCVFEKVVNSVEILDQKGNIVWYNNSDLGYTKRSSKLKSGEIIGIVLQVRFLIERGSTPEDLKKVIKKNLEYRKKYLETKNVNLGSVFVFNPIQKIIDNYLILKFIIRVTNFILRILNTQYKTKINKLLIFMFLGKLNLFNFISDKSFNCFVWVGDNALSEDRFFKYIDLIRKITNDTVELEIQIKSNK
ncbi:MAG: FAD-binding protein [Bacteroidales bacterium]|nr:FAD-binding protein [Bacteroidales bacterium]